MQKKIDAIDQESSVLIGCPYCGEEIQTNLEYECGVNTWMICFFLCVITQCCCCIPLFGNKYKDIIHKCPRCKKEVGIKEYECV